MATIAAVGTGGTSLKRCKRSVVLEITERLAETLTNELRELASRIPQWAGFLTNGLRMKPPPDAGEVVQEIAQLSSGQDSKTKGHVGRIEGCCTVWL